jgi:hypothetical protein
MFRVSHPTLYALSGIVWLSIGLMLLNTGLVLIMTGFQTRPFCFDSYSGFFAWFATVTGGPENAGVIVIGLALAIGFFKGRFVMQKAAQKSFERINTLPSPTSITNLYTRSNLLIIGFMIALGMSMKHLGLPLDIRGMIDTAVGAALMQGAVGYFHYANYARKKMRNES